MSSARPPGGLHVRVWAMYSPYQAADLALYAAFLTTTNSQGC